MFKIHIRFLKDWFYDSEYGVSNVGPVEIVKGRIMKFPSFKINLAWPCAFNVFKDEGHVAVLVRIAFLQVILVKVSV